MKIYRNKDNVCINIGEWDTQTIDGIERNPLPKDAVERCC